MPYIGRYTKKCVRKGMKMSINMTPIYETFGFSNVAGIAENVLMRMESADTEELWQAMDDELIYTADQWAIIEFYCTPADADFSKAWEDFY